MKTFKKLLTEGSNDAEIRSMLRSADNDVVYNVKERYYGVADHMQELTRTLNTLNGETGEFSADLTLAKKMLKLFDKMTLGKFL
jgi:hypothetical protein